MYFSENKKAHPIKSDELLIFYKICMSMLSDLSFPFLYRMELAPFPDKIGIGCQGFIGPLPSAFLDK
jgi:hypothetical protein